MFSSNSLESVFGILDPGVEVLDVAIRIGSSHVDARSGRERDGSVIDGSVISVEDALGLLSLWCLGSGPFDAFEGKEKVGGDGEDALAEEGIGGFVQFQIGISVGGECVNISTTVFIEHVEERLMALGDDVDLVWVGGISIEIKRCFVAVLLIVRVQQTCEFILRVEKLLGLGHGFHRATTLRCDVKFVEHVF